MDREHRHAVPAQCDVGVTPQVLLEVIDTSGQDADFGVAGPEQNQRDTHTPGNQPVHFAGLLLLLAIFPKQLSVLNFLALHQNPHRCSELVCPGQHLRHQDLSQDVVVLQAGGVVLAVGGTDDNGPRSQVTEDHVGEALHVGEREVLDAAEEKHDDNKAECSQWAWLRGPLRPDGLLQLDAGHQVEAPEAGVPLRDGAFVQLDAQLPLGTVDVHSNQQLNFLTSPSSSSLWASEVMPAAVIVLQSCGFLGHFLAFRYCSQTPTRPGSHIGHLAVEFGGVAKLDAGVPRHVVDGVAGGEHRRVPGKRGGRSVADVSHAPWCTRHWEGNVLVDRGDLEVVTGAAFQIRDITGGRGACAAGVVTSDLSGHHVVAEGSVRDVPRHPGGVGDAVQAARGIPGHARSCGGNSEMFVLFPFSVSRHPPGAEGRLKKRRCVGSVPVEVWTAALGALSQPSLAASTVTL
ncbi:hypothetical protein EYF80_054827 [Liparis tanakae]|uniref:Uncharacterized protein n=1 Tax=Liparis tanakae TaxID=230148 RepID=A0A4Z2F2U4_9TELE|nr:hypothetical protein EYF80_054827 [Liparis tanakae]